MTLSRIYDWFEFPHRLLATRRSLERPGARVLDIGCGNHSPSLTKKYFPGCVFHGVDNSRWNRDATDDSVMDKFFDIDLERPELLDSVENGWYDVVICSHVLEHLSDPYAVAARIARKLRPGGVLYVEVPAERSLRFPRAREGWMGIKGCLNFADDATHRTMVNLDRLAVTLREQGCEVGPETNRFLWRRILFLPAYACAGLVLRGYVPASVIWDMIGFAKSLTSVRRPASSPDQPESHE